MSAELDTLIAAEYLIAILAVLLLLVAVGLWMETRPKLGQYGVLSIILGASLLSTVGLIPRSAEIYSIISSYFVPLSIPMLLFKADIRRIWKESGRVFVAFMTAAFATVVGAFVAVRMVDLGPDEGVLAGIMTAGYIGGSANTAAVADAMGKLNDPIMALIVATAFTVGIPFLAFLLVMPGIRWLWQLFSPVVEADVSMPEKEMVAERQQITAFSLIGALALSACICALSIGLAEICAIPPLKYVLITLLSVGFATLMPKRAEQLHGHYELGKILIYCFFAVIGAMLNFTLAWESGSQLVLFSVVVMVVHLLLLSLGGRLFKLSGAELAVASNACILGAPTAAAMAVSKGWHNLTTPALLCGVFGYALANFIGISLSALL